MKKVILIGLGAVGLTYAVKLKDKCNLFVLTDRERMQKYSENPRVFNGSEQRFNYILPNEKFDADFIIICTKSNNLDEAILNIKNFVAENTIILSLINGISSEEKIAKQYPKAKVLKSYFIGHSAVRTSNNVSQDGVGELVVEHNESLEQFLDETELKYTISEDIEYSMWLKYTFNLFSNQTSAILNMNFGALKHNKSFLDFAKKIVHEVCQIAKYKGIKNLDNLEKDAISSLGKMCDEGKTSMLQDVLAKRLTEVDIFAGEIISLGKKYGVQTPYNQVLYDLIKIKEEDNEYSVHTC